MQTRDHEPRRDTLARYLRYSHLGIQFFASVGLFTFGGYWLDGRLGTGVVFTLSGLALGFAGGFYALYREVVGLGRKGKKTRGDGIPPPRGRAGS